MTTLTAMPLAPALAPALHPLDPLTPQEIERTVEILRQGARLGPRVRFVKVELREPPKAVVLGYRDRMPFEREAFACVLDAATAQTYEAVVSLTRGEVSSYLHIPGVQPSLMIAEWLACEVLLRNDPDFQAALRLRGVTDMSLVQVDTWSAGFYGAEEERSRRVVRPLIYVSAIDGELTVQIARKSEVEALIQRLGEEGISAVMDAVKANFGAADPAKDKADLKN